MTADKLAQETGNLRLHLPISKLTDGRLPFLPGTKEVFIDVGLSFSAPNSVRFLLRNPNSVVLAFEPNPHHYLSYFAAADFARNLWLLSESGRSAWMERWRRVFDRSLRGYPGKLKTSEFVSTSDRNRFFFFPTAIGIENGVTKDLFIHNHHGSSSLKRDWSGINDDAATFPVLVYRLDFFLGLIPEGFEWLTHLKVDAEGSDIEVLRSAGSELERFIFVSAEDPKARDFLEGRGFELFRIQKGAHTYLNSRYTGNLEGHDCFIRV